MLKYLLEKEFKRIRRDKLLPRIIFMIPLLQLIILPFAANFEMHNINLGVVDRDHSVTSRQLIEKVISSGYFNLTGMADSYRAAITSIESDEADILLEIPFGFEKQLGKEGHAGVAVAANAVNGTKGGIGSSYLSQIINSFNTERGWMPGAAAEAVKVSYLFNPHLDYKIYMVPGIMVFLLTIIGGFLSALNIVSEKEVGTIEQINVSPIPKRIFILSKLIPFWIIGFVLLTFSMIISWLVYGLIPSGSFGTIYLFAAVYLIAFTGFGLAISSVSATQQQAMLTAYFFMIIFALLSGLFTPISSMPEWAQKVTLFNPVRYFVEAMRMIYMKGSTLADLASHFAAVCAFALFFNLLALWCYRKNS